MSLFDVLEKISDIFGRVGPLLVAVALLYFLWGVKKYVTASETDGLAEARDMIVHGIILLFVMVSVWGLVNLIIITFKVGPNSLQTQNINIGGGGSGTRLFCLGRECD